MKRLEAKYAPLHLVPLIERLGTPQVCGHLKLTNFKKLHVFFSVISNSSCLSLFRPANRHCTRGWPPDQRTPLLRPFHVRGHPDAHPQLSARRRVARAAANQRGHARWRVHGVPPSLERHAVCLLHSSRHARVHSRVSRKPLVKKNCNKVVQTKIQPVNLNGVTVKPARLVGRRACVCGSYTVFGLRPTGTETFFQQSSPSIRSDELSLHLSADWCKASINHWPHVLDREGEGAFTFGWHLLVNM